MYVILLIALLSTFMLLNIMFSEYVEAKINVYKNEEMKDRESVRILVKYILMTIMAVFWSWYVVIK